MIDYHQIDRLADALFKKLEKYQETMTEVLLHEGKTYQLLEGRFLQSNFEVKQNINGFFYLADVPMPIIDTKVRLLFIPPVLDGNYLLATTYEDKAVSAYEENLWWVARSFANEWYEVFGRTESSTMDELGSDGG